MKPLHQLTAAEVAESIRKGWISPLTLMECLLSRIQAIDPSLKAWATLEPELAMGAARQSGEELKRKGPRGLLHGVPVGLKDIIYTAGMKTEAGSKVLAGFVPDYDATVVTRLKDAGAIILGKMVTTEFAFSDPAPTLSPWNRDHTPGGSSSGSAVGVAARMCPAALGSQTGGSTLRPASYNGVVGFKPTHGRLSLRGVIPVAPSNDHVGIIVRSVGDAALLLQAMAGYDPADPWSAREPVEDYLSGLESRRNPPHIGLLKEYFYDRADAETRSHIEAIALRFAQAGAKVEVLSLPQCFQTENEDYLAIVSSECATAHRHWFPTRQADYAPRLRENIELGLATSAVDYLKAWERRRQYRHDLEHLLTGVDLFLTPATPTPAPKGLATTGDSVFQRPWSSSMLPTIALPSGLSQQGLPLGVQLIGARFAEARLLVDARWCEEVLNIELAPPDFP